jgi:hypothetical protein
LLISSKVDYLKYHGEAEWLQGFHLCVTMSKGRIEHFCLHVYFNKKHFLEPPSRFHLPHFQNWRNPMPITGKGAGITMLGLEMTTILIYQDASPGTVCEFWNIPEDLLCSLASIFFQIHFSGLFRPRTTRHYMCKISSATVQATGLFFLNLSLHLEPLHQSYFYEGFLRRGLVELFAQAGFELRSSWSLPPE